MDKDAAEGVGKSVYKVEEEAAEEVMEKAASHMKNLLKYYMSPITLNMKSGPHSRKRQEKGYQRTW